jgi:hypothetical protein
VEGISSHDPGGGISQRATEIAAMRCAPLRPQELGSDTVRIVIFPNGRLPPTRRLPRSALALPLCSVSGLKWALSTKAPRREAQEEWLIPLNGLPWQLPWQGAHIKARW